MHLPRFELLHPESIAAAGDILAQYGSKAKLAAGGTDLFPRMKYGVADPEAVVSLRRVPVSAPVVAPDGCLRLSALMSLADVERSDLTRERAPLLVEAAHAVGSNQIRHMGTLGGNICLENRCVYYNQSHTFQFVEPCFKRDGNLCYLIPKGNRCWAVSAGDTVPALVSLGVRVVVNGAEKRSTLPVEELFTGNSLRPLDLGPSQIVTEIEIPAAPGSRGASFMKFSLRGGLEFAALNVAVVLDLAEDRQTCVEAKVALGAIAAGPVRARKAEAALNGQKLVRDLFSAAAEIAATEIIPVPRHEFSVPYLRKCLESQTRDALTLAYQRGSGLAA